MTTKAITPLRQRMIEDMNACKLCAGTQRGHILSRKRFAAFLKRSPDTATLEDIRRFQLHLAGVCPLNGSRPMKCGISLTRCGVRLRKRNAQIAARRHAGRKCAVIGFFQTQSRQN